MPARCFSSGVVRRCSTSRGVAPGMPTITSTMGTMICGSSSGGVNTTAISPIRIDVRIASGVRGELRNVPARRPAGTFLNSPLTPLAILTSILIGLMAVVFTPPEEEPQIIVPMVDVMVDMPGATPREVEQRLTTPLEKHLAGIPGVEYLYSSSMPGRSLVTVRFKVNEPLEVSLVKVYDQLAAHAFERPDGATLPLVQLRTIDDVPFLAVTLHSGRLNGFELRRIAQEVAREVESVPDAARVEVIGGEQRAVRVLPDPSKLAAYGVTILDLAP